MLKTQGLTPVTTEQGLAVAKKMGAQYMECSSKEMTGVEDIFERALLTVVANDRKTLEAEAAAHSSVQPLATTKRGSTAVGKAGAAGAGSGIAFGSDGVRIPIVKKKKRKCALV